jgi:Sec-independent protein translocase protein TatA
MQTIPKTALLLAAFNLGGGEITLILALVFIFLIAGRLPDLLRGLGLGFGKFRDELDDAARDAGRSAGGIYGKRALQALTPDNQVAELYNPKILNRNEHPKRRLSAKRWFLKLWRVVKSWFK